MKGHIKISTFFLAIFLSGSCTMFAQTQDSYDYQTEFTWGINKNSYGGLIGGFVFKKARKLNDRLLETYGLEVMNVKHPQEVRKNSQSTGNFFIYGKSNYLYALRLQYGRDLILFKKAPQQGVEIKAVAAVGPTIGVVAPYYIELRGSSDFITIREQYDPQKHTQTSDIYGPGRLFEGLGESKIKLGANLKTAINFELGTIKSQVTGFEAGLLIDAYTSKVVMVPTAENYAVYPVLFFTLFYGGRK
jgi:hypothetical protein